MNYRLPFTFAFACLSSLCIAHAQTATTDPVGVMSTEIPSHDGGSATQSMINIPFVKAADYSGQLDAATSNTLTDSDANWTNDEFLSTDVDGDPLFYAEITSGPQEGATLPITGNTATELTITEDVTGLLNGVETYVIRQFLTIADIFGADNSKFNLASGSSSAQADVLFIMDDFGDINRYYYQTAPSFAGGNGWRRSGDITTDRSNTRIDWNGILLARFNDSTLPEIEIIAEGTVRMNTAKTVISEGMNLVGYQFPVDTTLGNLGLDPADLKSGSSSASADVVFLIESNGDLNRYYYQEAPSFAGGDGWRRSGDIVTDQSNRIIDASTSVLIQKRESGSFYMSSTTPF